MNPAMDVMARTTLMTSLFHEPWWLDAAAPGGWDEVSVQSDGNVIARFPYVMKRVAGILTLSMPPLTRTLGPQLPLFSARGNLGREQRRLAGELISLLPQHGSFKQTFDPMIPDALAFYGRGYRSEINYTIRVAAEADLAERWSGIRSQMRKAIRKAEQRFTVESPCIEAFCEFHNHHMQRNHRLTWSDPFARRADQLKTRVFNAAAARNAACLLGARDEQGILRAAIMLVWGHGVMYYLLTAHDSDPAGAGAVRLLVWEALKLSRENNLAFDFDGFFRPSALNFQTGFGGDVCNRIVVTKTAALHRGAKAIVSRLRFGF